MALFDTLMPRPTALCFMPEFSNRLGGVSVQWSMGVVSLLSCLATITV